MIGYIKGSLAYIGEGYVIIEANGIGYNISVAGNTAAKLRKGSGEVKLYTVMNVREDSISLCGFPDKEELNMYKRLTNVSGVGSKVALSVLSALTPAQISLAVITGDSKLLSKGQGVGKKIAERIILELKDKIKTEEAFSQDFESSGENAQSSAEKEEAAEALLALGFSRSEAVNAVNKVYESGMTSENIIKRALKILS